MALDASTKPTHGSGLELPRTSPGALVDIYDVEQLQAVFDIAAAREITGFELPQLRSAPIVLFGAGGLGRKSAEGLKAQGIRPALFADNDSSRWGSTVDGIEVVSPPEAASRFGSTAEFIVAIWGAFSPNRMRDHVSQLRRLGCRNVRPFGDLFLAFPDTFMPHYAVDVPARALEQREAIIEAYSLWADHSSRSEFIRQLNWRLTLDFELFSAPESHPTYFPGDLRTVSKHEVFVDCGAYNGDTITEFLKQCDGSFEAIYAFEPDPSNFRDLVQNCHGSLALSKERVHLFNAAVADADGYVLMGGEGGPSASVGAGPVLVKCVRIDDAIRGAPPTIIKMDVEGSELDALRGAASFIRTYEPTLAISCYHKQDHLWRIPLLIRTLSKNYDFYLRPHDFEGWDLVCYALPRAKRKAP